MKREPVLKIETLRKIPIQKIINEDGWEKYYNNKKLILNPVLEDEQIFLELIWDNVCLGRFKLEEHTVGQLPYIKQKDGTIRRRSPMLVFCVVGSDNKRYRFLYFRSFPDGRFVIGTRHDLGARYSVDCMSRKQRNSPERIAMRLQREKRYERKLRRRMFGKNGFFRDREPPPPSCRVNSED
jgi:hypothetical protein